MKPKFVATPFVTLVTLHHLTTHTYMIIIRLYIESLLIQSSTHKSTRLYQTLKNTSIKRIQPHLNITTITPKEKMLLCAGIDVPLASKDNKDHQFEFASAFFYPRPFRIVIQKQSLSPVPVCLLTHGS